MLTSENEYLQGRIHTKNKMGDMFLQLSDSSRQFIDYAQHCKKPLVDIGCAYGVAALGAIRASSANKTPLIAIDLSQEHLDIVRENTPFADQTRLTTRCGRFPTEINFEDNSLSAFHAANIFHFLTGEEFELALAKAFKGLEPSGKIFTTVASIYSTRTDNFVEYYQRNLDKGIKWPGLVSDLRQFILNSGGVIDEENHMASNMVHFFRLQEYQKAVEAAGFIVEFCDYFDFENTGDEYERHPKSWITMVARKPQLMS